MQEVFHVVGHSLYGLTRPWGLLRGYLVAASQEMSCAFLLAQLEVFAQRSPAFLQIRRAAGHLKVVHTYYEEQLQDRMPVAGTPVGDALESGVLDLGIAIILPKSTGILVAV